MRRRMIRIDEARCNGCGACAAACHEGAIGMVNGKARLLREDYCDGLGDCLPACPVNAISFEEREAPAYDEAAVLRAKAEKAEKMHTCPGSAPRVMERAGETASRLRNWPVQIKLAPLSAPWLEGRDLLIAADCTAYAYAAFHADFIRDRTVLVGCPKLDGVDYAEKLGEIFRRNAIRSVTLARMEVPCCGGLEFAARRALEQSGKTIPLRVLTISLQGELLGEE